MADDNNQELKIHIVSDADNSGFKSAAAASEDLNREMGVVAVTNADVERATKKTAQAVEEGTEKFGESRREIREVGNELGNMAGVGRAGGLALGGVGAAAFGLMGALELLKSTWEATKHTIEGPIEIGLPPDAVDHINAVTEAWKKYAEARGLVIAASQGPEAGASAEEKKLTNELSLTKQVLAAEKEKALADLELHKKEMTPEEFDASRNNINNIFDEAGKGAEAKNRRALIANKDMEATNLEIDAKNKTAQALAIKSAPAAVAEANQKTLDANAASAETAKKEIQDRLALIDRVRRGSAGQDVPEYEGAYGKMQQFSEGVTAYQRYGTASFADMRGIETPRLAQAQAAIDTAAAYRDRETKAAEEKNRLMNEAGTESGKAAVLRSQVTDDSRTERRQNETDAHVANLHRESSAQVMGASRQTVEAVGQFTAATVGGFADVREQLLKHQQQLDAQREQIRSMAAGRR